jgi:hypothetical protein
MILARATILIAVLTAFTFTRAAAPDALRLRAAQGTVTKYAGKSDAVTTNAFLSAKGPGGVRLPDSLRDRLKVAFEKDDGTASGLRPSDKTTIASSSTETVLEARQDATRVVQVESSEQTSISSNSGPMTKLKFVRAHAPDGEVSISDLSVTIERNSASKGIDLSDQGIEALKIGARGSLVTQLQILAGCTQAKPSVPGPLMFDPKMFNPSAGPSIKPDRRKTVRVGDLRLEVKADGAECRVSVEPGRYGLKNDLVTNVSRYTLRFLPDGRLDRLESTSSTTIHRPKTAFFAFEGTSYRVEYEEVYRTSSSSDRLK